MSSNPKKAGKGEKIVRPESGARTNRRNSQNIRSKTRYFVPVLVEVAKKYELREGKPRQTLENPAQLKEIIFRADEKAMKNCLTPKIELTLPCGTPIKIYLAGLPKNVARALAGNLIFAC